MEGEAVRVKKLTIMILTTLVILALAGCGGDDGTAGSAGSTGDTATAEQSKETSQSPDKVSDSKVPLYPNAEEIYNHNQGAAVFYATSDSGEKVSKFYEGHPQLNGGYGPNSAVQGHYVYLTPVIGLTSAATSAFMSSESVDDIPQEVDELNEYIDEFGGLYQLSIFDANMDTKERLDTFELFPADFPLDKTVIMFAYQEKL